MVYPWGAGRETPVREPRFWHFAPPGVEFRQDGDMEQLGRLARIAGLAAGGGLYLWFAGVLNAPRVKARKEARRRERAALRTR
jgi:hypothetical protein